MSRTCTKCKNSIPDNEELGMVAAKYPTCNKCWAEWKEYQVMVMNEMKLDMSMLDHRKLLKKHEKIFVGVLSPEGEIIDYANEDNRKPEKPTGELKFQVFFSIFWYNYHHFPFSFVI